MLAVGRDPDGHLVWLPRLAAEGGELDLTLALRGLEEIGAETLHADHDRLTRSWITASAGQPAFSSPC
jgi:hypothetical protein